MEKEQGRKDKVVPFHKFFAVFGYVVFSLLTIGTLLELGAFACYSIHQSLQGDPVAKAMAASPSYNGYAWAPEFWEEERSRWKGWRDYYVPFRIWGLSIWHGKYVNTDRTDMGTWRRTVNAMSKECDKQAIVKLWMFGGSTVYGTGVPDSATLPSYLSQKLNAGPSRCVEVTNLGVEGYVTNQEVILLTELLKGGSRPDVVILYDGLNDGYVGGFSPGIASAHMTLDLVKARLEGDFKSKLSFLQDSYSLRLVRAAVNRLHRAAPARLSEEELHTRAEATLENYEANLTIVRALADAYKFKSYFFWQPTLFCGQKPTVAFEKQLIEHQLKAGGGDLWRAMNAVYREAERRSAASGGFTFMGEIFDRVAEPIYIDDWMHLGPLGNEIAAGEIAHRIELGPVDEWAKHEDARDDSGCTQAKRGLRSRSE
jgi:lysophospholipase L1-like esterase